MLMLIVDTDVDVLEKRIFGGLSTGLLMLMLMLILMLMFGKSGYLEVSVQGC